MHRLVTAASAAFATLALAACSATRVRESAQADVETGPAPLMPPPSSAPSGAGPRDAATLARETGLQFQDQGNSVLLSGSGTLARFFPGSERMSIDGRMSSMGAPAKRETSGLVIPATGVDAVRRAVSDAAARAADAGPLWTPPVIKHPQPVAASLKPIELPSFNRVCARPSAGGDPSWSAIAGCERAWRWIVVHHSDDESGCCAKYDAVHRQKGWDCCGYDFVIGNGTQSGDGQVEVGPRWIAQQTGAHAKTPDNRYNDYGVGIVLVGDFEHGCGPTPRQYDALVRLTRWLMARYGISPDRVLRHGDCKSTACPGRNFPWARFVADVS